MKPWALLQVNTDDLDGILADVAAHEADNPACVMGPYWKDRRGPDMLRRVLSSPGLPVGFVGNGWPEERDQSSAIEQDSRSLIALNFHKDDLNTRDVGDAIYQANLLLDSLPRTPRIADIGAGYGRLGAALWRHVGKYYAVDYTPIGLLVAPQFFRYVGASRNCGSIPAWDADSIPDGSLDGFVSVHSFQEMEPATIDFYISWIERKASPGAILYSVNIGDPDFIPGSWELMFERSYPINRDGNYLERMWKIK